MTLLKETYARMADVRRRISELVSRVVYGGERVILTYRNRPKAVIISLEGYMRLKALDTKQADEQQLAALQEIAQHRQAILERREGAPVEVDIVETIHAMREDRIDNLIGLTDCR